MAIQFYIPRFEWKETIQIGDTLIATDTILVMPDTIGIEVGMTVTGAGIPDDTTVLVVNANDVQMSADATTSETAEPFNFFWRYDFEFPPVKDTEFVRKPKNAVAASLSGLQQVQTSFLEGELDLEFWFIKQDEADMLRDNWYLWAYRGNYFRYFPDLADSVVYTVELNKYDFSRVRQIKCHPDFKYSLKISIRYVVE